MRLGRREFGCLTVALSAALTLVGCGPARADPTPEALTMMDSLVAELATIHLLTNVNGTVTTHVHTEPDIVVTAHTSDPPDRADLLTIGAAVQAAVDDHQLEGTHTGVTLRTAINDSGLNWHWDPTTPATPAVDQQVDAGLAEIDLGADSVTLDDAISSRWSTIDNAIILQAPPPGMRVVTRWVTFGQSWDFTVTIHAGQPSLEWPISTLVTEMRPFLHSLNLVVMDDWAHWQLALDIDDRTSAPFGDALVEMLQLLRTVASPARHTLDCTGPWWVNFAIRDTVSIDTWPEGKVRTVDEAVIQDVIDRANR